MLHVLENHFNLHNYKSMDKGILPCGMFRGALIY